MSILDDIRAAIEALEATRPVVYYGTSDAVERGRVYQVKKHSIFPAWWLFHPDDFPAIEQETSNVRWVHLCEYKPTHEEVIAAWQGDREKLFKEEIEKDLANPIFRMWCRQRSGEA